MKNKLVSVSLMLAAALFFCGYSTAIPPTEKVTLELLNPQGVIEPPKTLPLTPRVSDLAGKRIALVPNIKQGASQLLDVLAELLKQKYPGITVTKYPARPLREERAEEFQQVAKDCDVFVHAIGD